MKCRFCNESVVYYPFRQHVPFGKATFELRFPKHFLNFKFYFSMLELVPAYFSFQASQMTLDNDPELKAPLAHFVAFKTHYADKKKIFESDFQQETRDREISTFVKKFNDHFDMTKPVYVRHSPVFIDWIVVEEGMDFSTTMNTLVKTKSETFYDNPNDVQNYNALPLSIRNFEWVNNYILPTKLNIHQYVRLRINFAPYTKVTFSNDAQLETMGFVNRFEKKGLQYVYENDSPEIKSLVGNLAPAQMFKFSTMKSTVSPLDFTSPESILLASPEMLQKPELLVEEINILLNNLGEKTNVNLKLHFSKDENRYLFQFPANPLVNATIIMPAIVLEALGYEGMEEVNRASRPSALKSNDERYDTLKKSRALANDCGLTVVTQKHRSSCNLIGSTDHFMATLLSNDFGKMRMLKNDICSPTIDLVAPDGPPQYGHADVMFELSRFTDDGILRPLDWPCSAYLQGLLVGIACSCKTQTV